MSHAELIARYEKGAAALDKALARVPEHLLDRAPSPGKWTIRQIAVHLADTELVAATRIRFLAAEPGCQLPGFNQDTWANTLGYAEQTPEQVLALIRAVRQSTAAMLRTLPESAWAHTGNHSKRGKVTLMSEVELYAAHAEHHAQQIRELQEKIRAAT
jgi:NAD(P)H-dependent FMN reductase